MDTAVNEPAAAPAPVSAEPAGSADPFVLDEGKLASLSPEQRAALDPVLDEWKTRAKTEIEKTGKTYEEKYRPHQEKAQALEELVQQPWFQQAWANVQRTAIQQNPGAAGAIQQARPQDYATPQEWQTAITEAYQGDPARLQGIQQRMFATMATPVIMKLQEGQEQLRATLEIKDIFERHEDARELDLIGRNPADPNDKSESLLESCLEWADQNGKTLEEGYARARRWADSLKAGAQKQAMGLVQEKKTSITSGPSTNVAGQTVVEVESAEELMEKNMDYLAMNQKPPRFVIRPKAAPTAEQRWSQRT